MDLTDQERELLFLGVAAEMSDLPLRVMMDKEFVDFTKRVDGCVKQTIEDAKVSKKNIMDSVIDMHPRSFRYLSFGLSSRGVSLQTVKLTHKLKFDVDEKSEILEMIDRMIENTHEDNIKKGVVLDFELIIQYLMLIYVCIRAVDEELAVVFLLALQRINEVNANFFMFDENIFQYPIFLRALAAQMLVADPDTAKIIYDAIGFERDQIDLFTDMEIYAFRDSAHPPIKKGMVKRFFEDNAILLQGASKEVKALYAETLALGDLEGLMKMIEYDILDCKTFRFKNGMTIPEFAMSKNRRDLVDLCKTKMVRQFGFKK